MDLILMVEIGHSHSISIFCPAQLWRTCQKWNVNQFKTGVTKDFVSRFQLVFEINEDFINENEICHVVMSINQG